MKYKKTAGDILFDIILYTIVVFVLIVTIYPIVYTFSMAISDPIEAARGNVWLLPAGLSFSAMETVLKDPNVLIYYMNTIWYTVVGTLTGIITTTLMAYPLSRTEFRSRNIFYKIIMFTMFFSGGLIPGYLAVKGYGLGNSLWVMFIPSMIGTWNMIIMRSFFIAYPSEIIESGQLDGLQDAGVFFRLVLPTSKAALATIGLYYAVGYWNSYMPARLYIRDKSLYPVMHLLQQMIDVVGIDQTEVEVYLSSSVQYASIMVVVIPIMCVYPFIQKYFVKGVMVGSIKG